METQVRFDLQYPNRSAFVLHCHQSRSRKIFDKANHFALSYYDHIFPPCSSSSPNQNYPLKSGGYFTGNKQLSLYTKICSTDSSTSTPSLSSQSDVNRYNLDSNLKSLAEYDSVSLYSYQTLFQLIYLISTFFVKYKTFVKSIFSFTYLPTALRSRSKCHLYLDSHLFFPTSNYLFSAFVLFTSFMLTFIVFIDAAPSVERKLSNRIVNTKYGALRGHVVSLQNHKLQDVEVFLGKSCAFVVNFQNFIVFINLIIRDFWVILSHEYTQLILSYLFCVT